MKKVLAIAPYAYLPYYSGGQKFIAEFLQHLGKETELTVISVPGNNPGHRLTYQLVPMLKTGFSRYCDSGLVKKITELVIREKMDTVVWEHPYFAWLAFRVRKRTGVRTLIHTHNIEYQRFRSMGRWWWPILKLYEKRCFRKADGIFFITPEDREFAISKWNIPANKCFDLPFGTRVSNSPDDRADARAMVMSRHGINPDEKILLFTGLLSYKPNLDALNVILEQVNPRLLAQSGFKYRILICGKGLPDILNELKDYASQNVLYAGFVEDIEPYYKASDVFLNPVQTGGGIKTKMVESLAFGTPVVSTASGAAGMDNSSVAEKLKIVGDHDWPGFSLAILDKARETYRPTPMSFYERYNWEHIIRSAVAGFI
ncbi:MAG: glycosyltransferase family 4 protein [Chitinophagaceae bacterium]